MRITKGQGAVLSLLIMMLYVIPYYSIVKNTPHGIWLTALFFVGIFFHFLQEVKPGTRAELDFFHQATGAYWENGLCLVPSFFPMLHNIGIHLLWNLRTSELDVAFAQAREPQIHHFRDQREPEWRVNVETSVFWMQVQRITSNFFSWLFSINRGDPTLRWQRFGFRIVIIALILGAINNIIYSREESGGIAPSQGGESLVLAQLVSGPLPTMPSKESFEVTTDQYQRVITYGGRRYVKYQQKLDGSVPHVSVEESFCAIVPAGRDIVFQTMRPPTHAINMENDVTFMVHPDDMPLHIRYANRFFNGEIPPVRTESWKFLKENWRMVNLDGYGIMTKALKYEKLPRGSAGGLVCF